MPMATKATAFASSDASWRNWPAADVGFRR